MKNIAKKIITYTRRKVYDFFHPSLEDCLRDFAIVELAISHEEAERLREMLKEWEEKGALNVSRFFNNGDSAIIKKELKS